MNRDTALAALQASPLDPNAHGDLGDAWRDAGAHWAAQACYRSALFLGARGPGPRLGLAVSLLRIGRGADACRVLEPLTDLSGPLADDRRTLLALAAAAPAVPLERLDHNRYLRLRTLAREIRRLAGPAPCSVLDIGGGDGALAAFLPDDAYLLVEPATNGLSGLDLPLPAGSVDVVCACHVLEHIPPGRRDAFLDQLVATARGHVLLLNPFAAPGVDHALRLQLAVDLTGAGWAREHLECGLPELDSLRDYARRRQLALDLRPHGAVGTSFTVTMMHHFAGLAGRTPEAARINAYLNGLEDDQLTSPALPAAWLAHIDLGRGGPHA